jgi:hypothetical protein
MIGHTFSYDYGEHVEGASDHKVVITVDRDATIDVMVLAFRAYLLACGYQPENVNEYIEEI